MSDVVQSKSSLVIKSTYGVCVSKKQINNYMK